MIDSQPLLLTSNEVRQIPLECDIQLFKLIPGCAALNSDLSN